MRKVSTNTYIEGMNKDIDRALMSNKAYLEANNFRLITTQGSTTGSLENVRGNKITIPTGDMLDETDTYTTATEYFVLAGQITHDSTDYDAGDFFTTNGTTVAKKTGYTGEVRCVLASARIDDGQWIVGGTQLRDKVVLFTTNNYSSTPNDDKSCIYTMELDTDDEEQTSLTKIYDDSLNDGLTSSDFLNFSVLNPIKCVARYETENIQKVYWTDGYNYLRHVDVNKTLTVSGEAYSVANRYQSADKFNIVPNFEFTKPVLFSIISGTLNPGMVQYTYQLYKTNGSATTYAPLSDIIHITESNDYATEDYWYKGSSDVTVNSGKGCRVKIENEDNTGFDRVRLIRVYYATLNGTPSVDVVSEMEIPTNGDDFYINDVGDSVEELTAAELTIADSDLFICQDIATKDNRLFAANIETDYFDVGTYDSRVVRFRNWTDSGGGTDTINTNITDISSDVTAAYVANDEVEFTIDNFTSYLGVPGTRTVTGVTAISAEEIEVMYEDTSGINQFNSSISLSETVDSFGADTLVFTITTSGALFTDYSSLLTATLNNVTFTYTYTTTGAAIEDARVYDYGEVNEVTITVPASDTLSAWNTAGWEDYDETHDGINLWNDPDNEYIAGSGYDGEVRYIYQSDGETIGAEGPNIKVSLEIDEFILDDDSVSSDGVYYSIKQGTTANPSFNGFSSPWFAGKRSFQRGEVYRVSSVFHNNKGQASFPQWMCDFKMPSIRDTIDSVDYSIENHSTDTYGRNLYITVEYKNFPTDAVSAQLFVVPREASDRSVYTQGFASPFETTGTYEPVFSTTNIAGQLIKLLSPEVMINKNVKVSTNDYIEYLGSYDSYHSAAGDWQLEKLYDLTTVTVDEDNKADVDDTLLVVPTDDGTLYSVGSISCANYNSATYNSYGSSGLLIKHDNASWDAIGAHHCLVNYRKNIFDSQYGGPTYEARTYNYYRPASDIMTETETEYTCNGGDTFITYFDVTTLLFDLSQTSGSSEHETVYIPLESSINCNLRHDSSVSRIMLASPASWWLIQEIAGEHEDGSSNVYTQDSDLYQYNTVYSQLDTLGYKYAKPFDWEENTEFDVMIKSSNTKVNGELSDSWCTFPTNDFIEVDSSYGPINAIHAFNNRLYYFQDRGLGVVSVNPRSLIQDSDGSELVLGTGGVLDRYDYISQEVGCEDKFSVVKSKTSLYWFDREGRSIYKLGESLSNLTRIKYIHSHLETYYKADHVAIAAYDKQNDEVLFTFYSDPWVTQGDNYENSYTLAYNELVDCFPSFYSMIPVLWIPYKNKLLTTTESWGLVPESEYWLNPDRGMLWFHDSDNVDRCYFWSADGEGLFEEWFVDSDIELLFNPEYQFTKVFDNITFVANAWNRTEITGGFQDNTSYNEFFDTMQFYNDYQNTGEVTLTYNTNLRRRERGWSMYIPRNIVDTSVTSDPNIFTATDSSRTFKERMRGKYLIGNFTYNNGATHDKFVVSDILLYYRKSFR